MNLAEDCGIEIKKYFKRAFVQSTPPEKCKEVKMSLSPSEGISSEDLEEFRIRQQRNTCLSMVKNKLDKFPEDLFIRKTYISILKFLHSNKKGYLDAEAYEKWASSSDEMDLISPEKMKEFLISIRPSSIREMVEPMEAKYERS